MAFSPLAKALLEAALAEPGECVMYDQRIAAVFLGAVNAVAEIAPLLKKLGAVEELRSLVRLGEPYVYHMDLESRADELAREIAAMRGEGGEK